MERVAAVDKIEEKRKPEDFIGHRNRADEAKAQSVLRSADDAAVRGKETAGHRKRVRVKS